MKRHYPISDIILFGGVAVIAVMVVVSIVLAIRESSAQNMQRAQKYLSEDFIQAEIAAGRERWSAVGVKDYILRIEVQDSSRHSLEKQVRTVVYKGDAIKSNQCGATGCPAVGILTVDGLFLALDQRSTTTSEKSCVTALEMNARFGYPELFTLDCQEAADDKLSIKVIEFQVMP